MFMRTLREPHFHTDYVMHVTSSHDMASILGEKGHQSLAFSRLQKNWEMIGHRGRGESVEPADP